MPVLPEEFTRAMRQFPAAVNLITTGGDAGRAGLTATAVMSLTAEPPQIGVAVNRTASAYPALQANAAFCVNTLAADQAALARRFSGQVKGEERFALGRWTTLATGAPALADALVCLDCRIVREVDLGTHTLFIGQVEAIRQEPMLKPLLFVEGDWAGLVSSTSEDMAHFRSGLEQSIGAIETAAGSGAPPSEQLRQFVRSFTKIYIAQQDIARKYLGAHLYVSPAAVEDLKQTSRLFDDKLTRLLEAGSAHGAFELSNPRLAAFAISGLIAWVHRWYRVDGALGPDEIAEQMSDLVMRIVTPRCTNPQDTP